MTAGESHAAHIIHIVVHMPAAFQCSSAICASIMTDPSVSVNRRIESGLKHVHSKRANTQVDFKSRDF